MTSPWKLLCSLPVVAILIAGCSNGANNDGKGAQVFDSEVLFDPVPTAAAAYSNCSVPPLSASPSQQIIPFPFDALFSGFTTPTLNIPNPTKVPTVAQINMLDGFSTVGDIFFDVAGFIDYSTVAANLIIINSATGAALVPGVDFTIQPELATAQDPLTCAYTPIETQRSRVLIELMKPLAPATQYLVAVTKGVKTLQGGGVIASPEFTITASATPVSQQNNPFLANFNPNTTAGATDLATLEALRQTINPVVAGISTAAGINSSNIVLAWSFTTQSEGLSLASLAAKAAPDTSIGALPTGIAVAPTGLTTDELGQGLPPGADIYAGVVVVPYYLKDSGGNPFSTDPLTSFWLADPTQPNVAGTFLGQVPCGAFVQPPAGTNFVPSTSTTGCFPVPVKQSDEVIPLLVTVPNAASGHPTAPANGWPVVIFQHGITRMRTDMFAIAPAFAAAGFVTVAIDMPLHGITDTDPNPLTNPFYHNQLFTGSPAAGLITGERTFDLALPSSVFSTDATGCTAALPPTGQVDPSGLWFINLSSLLTGRDNLRQAEADLMTLRASLANLQFSGIKIDTTQIRYSGISLGSIVGIPYLANDTKVGAASLAVPGGGIAKLLDASGNYGLPVSLGLACITVHTPFGDEPGPDVAEGSDDYDTFMRLGQTAIDDGDPLNYAAAAVAAHPIHLIEVVGGGVDASGNVFPADEVVPNSSLSTCPSTLDPATIVSTASLYAACPGNPSSDVVIDSSYDGGTNPLIAAMGLTVIGPINDISSIPVSVNTAGEYAVKFGQGYHHSLESPTDDSGNVTPLLISVTTEMQTEAASFLASNGQCLPVGTTCPAP